MRRMDVTLAEFMNGILSRVLSRPVLMAALLISNSLWYASWLMSYQGYSELPVEYARLERSRELAVRLLRMAVVGKDPVVIEHWARSIVPVPVIQWQGSDLVVGDILFHFDQSAIVGVETMGQMSPP